MMSPEEIGGRPELSQEVETGTRVLYRARLGGRAVAIPWDQRETGSTCLLEPMAWNAPEPAPMSLEEARIVADMIVHAARGPRVLIGYAPQSEVPRVLAWDRGEGGRIGRIHVEEYPYPDKPGRGTLWLLEARRTARVPFAAVIATDDAGRPTYGEMRARLDPGAGHWLVPEERALEPDEWLTLRAWLAGAAPSDFFLTSRRPVFSDSAGSL